METLNKTKMTSLITLTCHNTESYSLCIRQEEKINIFRTKKGKKKLFPYLQINGKPLNLPKNVPTELYIEFSKATKYRISTQKLCLCLQAIRAMNFKIKTQFHL